MICARLTSSARANSADATPNSSVCVAFLNTLLPRESSTSNVSLRPAGGLMIRAVERQRAYVDGLAGLIDGLLRGEQNRHLIFQPDRLA